MNKGFLVGFWVDEKPVCLRPVTKVTDDVTWVREESCSLPVSHNVSKHSFGLVTEIYVKILMQLFFSFSLFYLTVWKLRTKRFVTDKYMYYKDLPFFSLVLIY